MKPCFVWKKKTTFLSKIEKNQFLLKIRASIKFRLLDLSKLNIYQIQPGGLLKAPSTQNIIFWFGNRVFSTKLRNLGLCLKSAFCVKSRSLCGKSCFLVQKSKNRFLPKNSASIKLRLLNLLKRNIYQTQHDRLLKAPIAKNLICFCLRTEILVKI